MSGTYRKLLVLPNIAIHNANALSSPFTIGFPAMTAWLGATHALQRQLNQKGFTLTFLATGIVSHEMNLQTYRGDNDYVASIIGTANPLDKTGARSAFIEEARCHLTVSLVIEVQGVPQQKEDELKAVISQLLHGRLKMASGDIQSFGEPTFFTIEDQNPDDTEFKRLIRKLMPGYALIERRELMIEAMEQGQDAIDALVDYLAIHHSCRELEDGSIVWESKRKRATDDKPVGWVVPIATGFHGISELGQAKNQRDPDTPHRFAESLVTLGEFKMPYRFTAIDELLWRYHYDAENQLYQCTQSVNQLSIIETIDDEF